MKEEEKEQTIKFVEPSDEDKNGEMHDLDDFYDEDYYDEYDDDGLDFTPKPDSSRGAWSSLILGIVATIGWIIPVIGLPITIVGIVLGAINLKSKKSKGAAISGFVINIVFLLVTIAKGIVDIVRYFKKQK